MRVLVTGQVGLDKKAYLEQLARHARDQGEELSLFHIGDMMYREAPDVPPGRILDLPLARLHSLRRAVMRDVLAALPRHKHVLINTHATFRWRHGLFSAFDFDQLAQFDADLYVTLVDNIESVHQRMVRDTELDHSLKDLMVWREEEILATEICAKAHVLSRPQEPASLRRSAASSLTSDSRPLTPKFYVLSRGRHTPTVDTLFKLVFRPHMKKVYPSFPMSHVTDLPDTLAEINAFRATMAQHFITFDPGDVDEKLLADKALAAAREGKQHIELATLDEGSGAGGQGSDARPDPAASASAPRTPHPASTPHSKLPTREVLDIAGDIDGQIYSRDFILVRQADMIVSYIPELPTGKPGLSSGVERELQHAHEHAKDVYVIWKPAKEPSPFITQTANKVFRSVDEAVAFFEHKGYFAPHDLFGS